MISAPNSYERKETRLFSRLFFVPVPLEPGGHALPPNSWTRVVKHGRDPHDTRHVGTLVHANTMGRRCLTEWATRRPLPGADLFADAARLAASHPD